LVKNLGEPFGSAICPKRGNNRESRAGPGLIETVTSTLANPNFCGEASPSFYGPITGIEVQQEQGMPKLHRLFD